MTHKHTAKTAKAMDAISVRLVREWQNIETGDHHLELEFQRRDGWATTLVPRSDLNEKRALFKALYGKGWRALGGQRDRDVEALQEATAPIYQTTHCAGWHGDLFVTSYGTFGSGGWKSDPLIRLVNDTEFAPKGKSSIFLREFAAIAAQSNFLILAYLVALLPALASRLELKGGFTLFLSGETSTGKTTLGRLIQSIFQAAGDEADLHNFGDTIGAHNKLHLGWGGQAIAFNDIKTATESGPALINKIKALIFRVASGQRRRMATEVNANDLSDVRPNYCVAVLSAEQPLAHLFAENHITLEGGEQARWIEVSVGKKEDGGILSSITDKAKRYATFARLEALISSHHGYIGRKWIKHVAKLDLQANNWEDSQDSFKATNLEATNSLQRRVGRNFALMNYAAQEADRAGLLPVTLPTAQSAICAIMRDVLKQLGKMPPSKSDAFKAVAKCLLHHLEYRPLLKTGVAPTADQDCSAGFKRKADGSTVLYIARDAISDALGPDSEMWLDSALDHLIKEKIIIPGRRERTKPIQQEGLRRRRYLQVQTSALTLAAKSIGLGL